MASVGGNYYQPYDKYLGVPEMQTTTYIKDVTLLISKFTPNSGCGNISESFGKLPRGVERAKLFTPPDGRLGSPCFISGTVPVRVGVTRSQHLPASVDVPYLTTRRPSVLEPDRWTGAVDIIVPRVLEDIGISNITNIPRWDTLDGYVKSMIHLTYSVTWDAAREYFSIIPSEKFVPPIQVDMMVIVVYKRPVLLWLGLHLLFTASGFFTSYYSSRVIAL
jgi:hypothetical protein